MLDAAFSYCNDLENIVIPSSVINIEDSAFSNCKSLEKIIIPDGIIKIGDLAFSYCSSLVNISVDENNKNYKSINGNLYSYDGKKLIQYAIGKKDDLFITPNNLEVIGSSAFDTCNYLKNVIISNNVNRICSYAFFNCESLESVIIPKNILYINKCAFKDCDALTIYCEAESKPDTWSKKWNESNCNVIWNYTTNI